MDQLEIMSECVIKIENIKQEAADHTEEEAYNFMEGDGTFALKSEVEEGGEEEGDRTYPSREALEEDDEEEIKPPFEVFLDAEEVPIGGVKQEQKDPLAMCNENLFGDSALPVGGECGIVGDTLDSKAQIRNAFCTIPLSNDGNYQTLDKGRASGSESLGRNGLPEKGSRFPKTNSETSCSRSGRKVGIGQKEEGGDEHTNFKSRNDSSHQCSLCEKSFTLKHYLVIHMRTHSGCRPHECSICQKCFTKRSDLVSHTRIHSGDRPHKCTVCQKSFTVSSHLVRHMRTHSGERPHECSVCQKCFTRRSDLVSHMRTHSGCRPHECSVCQKCFTKRSDLVSHTRIHSGDRPHKCTVCQKSFTVSSHLVRHTRIHSGERLHKCTVCEKRFSQSSNLVRHMRIHSGDIPH